MCYIEIDGSSMSFEICSNKLYLPLNTLIYPGDFVKEGLAIQRNMFCSEDLDMTFW